eukprot:2670528-Prymnesium_polylepis.1
MPPRPRACAHRPSMTFLGACGSAEAAGGMSAQRGGMGACAAHTVRRFGGPFVGRACHGAGRD